MLLLLRFPSTCLLLRCFVLARPTPLFVLFDQLLPKTVLGFAHQIALRCHDDAHTGVQLCLGFGGCVGVGVFVGRGDGPRVLA